MCAYSQVSCEPLFRCLSVCLVVIELLSTFTRGDYISRQPRVPVDIAHKGKVIRHLFCLGVKRPIVRFRLKIYITKRGCSTHGPEVDR